MSALPLKADICGATWDVCFGPKADSCSAHLVGAPDYRVRNGDAERLGGLEIYDQFDFLNVAVFVASPPTGKFCSQIATVKSNNLRTKAAFQEDA
jgi:hypothetical protein